MSRAAGIQRKTSRSRARGAAASHGVAPAPDAKSPRRALRTTVCAAPDAPEGAPITIFRVSRAVAAAIRTARFAEGLTVVLAFFVRKCARYVADEAVVMRLAGVSRVEETPGCAPPSQYFMFHVYFNISQ